MTNNNRKITVGLKRFFITLLFGFVALLVALFSVFLVATASSVEDKIITQRLLQEASYLKDQFRATSNAKPKDKYVTIYWSKADIPAAIRSQIQTDGKKSLPIKSGGKVFKYYHFFIGLNQEAFLVVDTAKVSLFSEIPTELIAMFLLLLAITCLLAISVIVLIFKKAIYPIVALTDSIQKERDTLPQIPESLSTLDNEIGFLATTLNNTFDNLPAALDRESEFTRDVSHELRTPISVIMNVLSLSDERTLSTSERDTIKKQMHLMNSKIDILLALARAESIKQQEIRLISCIEDAALSIHKWIAQSQLQLNIDVPQSANVVANEHLLKLMLTNLIENAIKYSTDKVLNIAYQSNSLVFTNSATQVIDNAVMQKSQKQKGSEGFGQGLFLVARILHTLNWRYELTPSNNEFKLTVYFK